MFLFGDPEDLATLYYENALVGTGPGVVDLPPDEMSEEELRALVVYIRTAAEEAMRDDAGVEVVAILVGWYDTFLQLLLDISPELRQVILTNRHSYLGGHTTQNIAKYKAMASAT